MKVPWTVDNLWVAAENQMGGWEACDSINGHLVTYATFEEANNDAMAVVDDLNEGILDNGGSIEEHGYQPEDWGAQLLKDVRIGDNQEYILFPNGVDSNQMHNLCTGIVYTIHPSHSIPIEMFLSPTTQVYRIHTDRAEELI